VCFPQSVTQFIWQPIIVPALVLNPGEQGSGESTPGSFSQLTLMNAEQLIQMIADGRCKQAAIQALVCCKPFYMIGH
jgi:hypothetical protein